MNCVRKPYRHNLSTTMWQIWSIEILPPGGYNLLVGGINEGTITVVNIISGFKGEIDFDTDPDDMGELPLEFDPRGKMIEIEQGGILFLERTFPEWSLYWKAVCSAGGKPVNSSSPAHFHKQPLSQINN